MNATLSRTLARTLGLVAAPLAGALAAIAAYGPARLVLALGGLQTDTTPVPERLAPGGTIFPAGTVYHPYAADLVGVFSALVLVGLFVAWLVATLALAPGRRPLYRGRHVKVS